MPKEKIPIRNSIGKYNVSIIIQSFNGVVNNKHN